MVASRGRIIAALFLCAGFASAAPPDRLQSAVTAPRIDFETVDPLYREAVMRDGNIDVAVARLQALSREAPRPARERANALLVASFLQWKSGLRPAAQASVAEALQLAVTADIALQQARLLEAAGELEQAQRWYEQALGLITDPVRKETVRLRMTVVSVGPQNVGALVALAKQRDRDFRNRAAVAMAVLGRYKEAAGLYQVYGDAGERFRQHLRLAQWALESGDAGSAQAHAWSAAQIASLERDRRYALGVLVDAHETDQSLDVLLKRLQDKGQLSPDEQDVRVNLLQKLGRYDDAIRVLSQGDHGEIAPASRRQLLRMYGEAGRAAQMVAEYDKLITAEPRQPAWVEGLAQHLMERNDSAGARGVWQAFIERNQESGALLSGAAAMVRFGFDDLAVAAADKSLRLEPSVASEALLFRFELELRRGRTRDAGTVLVALDGALAPDAAERADLADAYERLSKPMDALRVLEALDGARAGGVGMNERMRMAWLYDSTGQRDKAVEVWKKLWNGEATEASRRLVEDRLVKLAAETGALGDLAVELEAKLADGAASRGDASLLVRIYTDTGDAVSAVEVIEEYFAGASRGAAEVESLREQATVYRSLGRNAAYETVTRRLLQIDPENRIDYLQSLILMKLEGGNPSAADNAAQIRQWLEQLSATGGAAATSEFKAGIMVLAGQADAAIETYRKALARHPEQSDNYLLLADLLRGANRSQEAIGALQYLVETAVQDDAFIIGVDGILNLVPRTAASAEDRAVLEWAQRRVLERLAGRDDKLYLYDLLGELAESTRNTEMYFSALENSLAYANSRRSTVLRELISASAERTPMNSLLGVGAAGRPDAARHLRYSRRLASLGEELPPEVHMDLGRALLKAGDVRGAENAFNVAADSAGDSSLVEKAGDLLRAAGYGDEAAAQYQRALIADAGSVALTRKLAEMRASAGALEQARALYLQALLSVLRGLPEKVEQAGRNVPPAFETVITPEYREHYAALFGLLMYTLCAGDPAFTRLEQEFTDLLEASAAESTAAGLRSLAFYPRLNGFARLLREIAARNGRYDLADDLDRRLLQSFPADAALAGQLLAERHEWGVPASAARLGVAIPAQTKPRPVADDPLSAKAAASRALARQEYDRAIRLAVFSGDRELPLAVYRAWLDELFRGPRTNTGRNAASVIAEATGWLTADGFARLSRYVVDRVRGRADYQRALLTQRSSFVLPDEASFLLAVEKAAGQPLMSEGELLALVGDGSGSFDRTYAGARLAAADTVALFSRSTAAADSATALSGALPLLKELLAKPLNARQSDDALEGFRQGMRRQMGNTEAAVSLRARLRRADFIRVVHPDNIALVRSVEGVLAAADPAGFERGMLEIPALLGAQRHDEALPLIVDRALSRFGAGGREGPDEETFRAPGGRAVSREPALEYLGQFAARLYPSHQAALRRLPQAKERELGLTPAVFALQLAVEAADPASTAASRLQWQEEMAQRYPDKEFVQSALSRSYASLGYVDGHLDTLRRLVALAPADDQYRRELFAALNRMDDPVDAVAIAGAQLGQFAALARGAASGARSGMGGQGRGSSRADPQGQGRRAPQALARSLEKIVAVERDGGIEEARIALLGLLQQLSHAGTRRAGEDGPAFSYGALFALDWPGLARAGSGAEAPVWGGFLDRLIDFEFAIGVLESHLGVLGAQDIHSQYPFYALLAEAYARNHRLQERLTALTARVRSTEVGIKERVLWLQMLLRAPPVQAASLLPAMEGAMEEVAGYEQLLLARVQAHAGNAARAADIYAGLVAGALAYEFPSGLPYEGRNVFSVAGLYEDAGRFMGGEGLERLARRLLDIARPTDATTVRLGYYERLVLGMLERTPDSAVVRACFQALMQERGAEAQQWSSVTVIRSVRALARQGQTDQALGMLERFATRGASGGQSGSGEDPRSVRQSLISMSYSGGLGLERERQEADSGDGATLYQPLFPDSAQEWPAAAQWLQLLAARLLGSPQAVSSSLASAIVSAMHRVEAPIDAGLLRGLIEHRRLDVRLLAPLLGRIAATEGPARALDLGEIATTYTQEPQLLQTVKSLAAAAGRADLVQSVTDLERRSAQAREAIAASRAPAPAADPAADSISFNPSFAENHSQ